jgi:hypothetical protein
MRIYYRGERRWAPNAGDTQRLQINTGALKTECKFKVNGRVDGVHWQTGWTVSGSTNGTTFEGTNTNASALVAYWIPPLRPYI